MIDIFYLPDLCILPPGTILVILGIQTTLESSLVVSQFRLFYPGTLPLRIGFLRPLIPCPVEIAGTPGLVYVRRVKRPFQMFRRAPAMMVGDTHLFSPSLTVP